MKKVSSRTMQSVLLLLRSLIIMNLVALGLFLVVLAWSFSREFGSTLIRMSPPEAAERMLYGVRAVMILGILIVPAAHLLLTRLVAIVGTVRGGDPFVPDNARRLQSIAWCLLLIQLLDLGFGAVSLAVEPALGWTPSLTGWIGVVLLFVLGRVFQQGTDMRDELAGTV